MDKRKAIKSLIYSSLILLTIIIFEALFGKLKLITSTTFKFFPLLNILHVLFHFLVGIILGAGLLIEEFFKAGKWRLNWERLLLGFAPFFIITVYLLVPFIFVGMVIPYNPEVMFNSRHLFALIAGYFLVGSFDKITDNQH